MASNHTEGRRAEFRRRGIETFITSDNKQILLEKDTLIDISNLISGLTGRKMSQSEIELLISYISEMPPRQFYGKALSLIQQQIASIFVSRYGNMVESEYEHNSDNATASLYDYLNDEVKNFSKNEHPYKYTAHVSRSGSSVISEQPERVVSINDSSFTQQVSAVLQQASSFMSQKNIDAIIEKNKIITPDLQTFNNITLPRRVIPLDSRNRLLSQPNSITWNLHSAGHAGRLGDVRIQDTLCEIIQFKICPFWLPVHDSLVEYYGKVRMLIRELWQSAIITEFLDPLETVPTTYNYHIEFDIQKKAGNRLYLVPVCHTYTFSKPVARLETITVEFRSPFNIIALDTDRGIFTMTPGITPADPTLFSMSSGSSHGLSTGDLVYIINAGTSSATINNSLNRVAGWIVTRINNTDFTIELDTSSVGPQSEIIVLYGSKRIILQLEFISLQH